MKLFEIVFSPTGRTSKVCENLGEEFVGERGKIDLMRMHNSGLSDQVADKAVDKLSDKAAYEMAANDVCIIAVPSFGGRVPAPAVDALKKINGNQAKAILVTAYGNRAYDDTLLELKDIAQERGFVCIAAIAAATEHSMMRQFGKGRPDEKDKKELQQYAREIFQMLEEGKPLEPLTVPGNRPYQEFGGLPLSPKATKACNRCGACADICPTGAISRENPKAVDKEKCITCMACVSACPRKARKLNGLILAVASHKMKNVCSTRKENKLMMGENS